MANILIAAVFGLTPSFFTNAIQSELLYIALFLVLREGLVYKGHDIIKLI